MSKTIDTLTRLIGKASTNLLVDVHGGQLGEWTTSDDYATGLWLAQNCHLLVRGESSIVAGVTMASEQNKFHPPREWLDGLPAWDGVGRPA